MPSAQKLDFGNSSLKTRKSIYQAFLFLSTFTAFLHFIPNILSDIASFKMLLLKRIFCYNFKSKMSMYSYFRLCIIYLILYKEVPLGICIWEKTYFIHLNCHISTFRNKETKSNDLNFIKLWKFIKQAQGCDNSNVRVLRSAKGI